MMPRNCREIAFTGRFLQVVLLKRQFPAEGKEIKLKGVAQIHTFAPANLSWTFRGTPGWFVRGEEADRPLPRGSPGYLCVSFGPKMASVVFVAPPKKGPARKGIEAPQNASGRWIIPRRRPRLGTRFRRFKFWFRSKDRRRSGGPPGSLLIQRGTAGKSSVPLTGRVSGNFL